MKRTLYILFAGLLFLAGFTSCADETMMQNNSGITANGDIQLKVTANIPAPKQVITRDIDPDGLGVNTLWLFCFNEYGEYIGRREAGNFATTDQAGYYSFDVEIPSSTRRIHFLSNVYLDDFNDRDNFGRNETTVIPSFVSASGRMCYWGRVAFSNESDLDNFANGGNVTLYRNQAQVRWDTTLPQGMNIYGYAICNRRAWGTIAPFDINADETNEVFNFDLNNPYVTEPAEEYQILASDPTQVTVQGDKREGDPHYIFENPNTLDAPVYAIMRIGINGQLENEAKYYKIMFVDDEKNQLEIYRNYEYVIRITGLPESMGYNSFDEAKNGVAANNAWVSVDPEIPELTDGNTTVSITNGTTQVFTTGGNHSIDFTYDGNVSDISVEWLEDGRNVSSSSPTITSNGNNHSINITLNTPTNEPQMGTLLLRTGEFTRQIKVYLVKPFSFEPVWVSTGVPMNKGEQMSMTFVIPDNYPEELFPIECKIATNKMNAHDDLEEPLPIVMEKCEYDIIDDDGQEVHVTSDLGYKYVYTATEPGVQEIFFTLNTSDGDDFGVTWNGAPCPNNGTDHGHVFIEADYFNDAHRLVKFQQAGENISNRRITIEGSPDNNPGFLVQEISPTVDQPIQITLNFRADKEGRWGENTPTPPQSGTIMRVATAVATPVDESIYLSAQECESLGLPTSNNIMHYYYYRFENNNTTELNLSFVTNTSDVEDIIRFSIDKENGLNPNLDEQYLYKSAGVELKANPERFTFENFKVEDDNPSVEGVKYGLNQPIYVSFNIPQGAATYNDVTFYLATQNLVPADNNTCQLTETEGGYNFTVPQGTTGTVTLNFLTNRIANGETITIEAVDNTALFAPASVTFSNTPIKGTLKLSDNAAQLATNSFITLERKNGTRVGIITVKSVDGNNVASYEIDLRSEYDFTMDEELTIYYNALDPAQENIYQATTTFQELVNDAEDDGQVTEITLVKR